MAGARTWGDHRNAELRSLAPASCPTDSRGGVSLVAQRIDSAGRKTGGLEGGVDGEWGSSEAATSKKKVESLKLEGKLARSSVGDLEKITSEAFILYLPTTVPAYLPARLSA